MSNKQLAALYIELSVMYYEEFPDNNIDIATFVVTMEEKIESGELSKEDILKIEPIFKYGHIDVHRHLKPKKRFIWF